jgi:hypothetical protein
VEVPIWRHTINCPTDARIVVVSHVSVAFITSLINEIPSSAVNYTSVCTESMCYATILAYFRSVPPFIPQQNVLIGYPSIRWLIAATRLESTPPESKKAMGLSASSLRLTARMIAVLIRSRCCSYDWLRIGLVLYTHEKFLCEMWRAENSFISNVVKIPGGYSVISPLKCFAPLISEVNISWLDFGFGLW